MPKGLPTLENFKLEEVELLIEVILSGFDKKPTEYHFYPADSLILETKQSK